jgi:uncharacterized protein YukE
MLTGGGDAISVEPTALEDLAAKVSGVADNSPHGQLSGVASAADACAGPVAHSFGHLQSLIEVAATALAASSVALSRATVSAAGAYRGTDDMVFGPVEPGCGPVVP